jgi:hypothetical protein
VRTARRLLAPAWASNRRKTKIKVTRVSKSKSNENQSKTNLKPAGLERSCRKLHWPVTAAAAPAAPDVGAQGRSEHALVLVAAVPQGLAAVPRSELLAAAPRSELLLPALLRPLLLAALVAAVLPDVEGEAACLPLLPGSELAKGGPR